jgi:hypothetical protein
VSSTPISDGEAQLALEAFARTTFRFRREKDIERVTAEKVSEGKIVARVKDDGFSILARADAVTTVPGVCRARDAVGVFLTSGLHYMAIANWWVEKP